MSKEKTTIEFFQDVASGLSYVADHINPYQSRSIGRLLQSIRRDESELQKMTNIMDDLRDKIQELEEHIEMLEKKIEQLEAGDA